MVAIGLERLRLGRSQVERHRKQQCLRRSVATLEHAHELLEQHPLVRRMLVDEDDRLVSLEQNPRAPQLRQRRDGDRFPRVGSEAVGAAGAPIGRRGLVVTVAEQGCRQARWRHAQQANVHRRPRLELERRGGRRREPDGRFARLGAERAPHRALDGALHVPPIPESDLGLGRMHIHVHIRSRHRELEQEGGANAGRNGRPVRGLGGADHSVVAHGAAVHGDEDAPARQADVDGTLDQPADAHRAGQVVDGDKPIRGVDAPERGHALAQGRRGREGQRLAPVVGDRETDVPPGQRHGGQHVDDRPPLGSCPAKEFLAGRRVVEQRFHGDIRAAASRPVADAHEHPAGDAYDGAGTVDCRRFDLEARHRTDSRQRLATKAEAGDPDEILCRADLRRGVPLDREHGVVTVHPRAVIAHANGGAATFDDRDVDRRRASVERVLHQFLDHRRRALDDLAGGNLVGDGVRQDGDARCGVRGGH